jgi:hypothetical protein
MIDWEPGGPGLVPKKQLSTKIVKDRQLHYIKQTLHRIHKKQKRVGTKKAAAGIQNDNMGQV